MTLPNFLIIGAAKCGTSSLYMYLKQHPDIFMSPIKEPHFFSFTSETKKTQGPGDTVTEAITDLEEYVHLFDGVKNEKAIGEASPTYIYQPNAAKRIHNLIPNAKLIAILRNPADRAFSAFMHVVRDRREPENDFSTALMHEQQRIEDGWGPIWHYKNGGYYFEQLSRYYDLFPPEQIKVLLYDDLISNPAEFLKKIFHFLEVNENFLPDTSLNFNVSGKQKSKLIHTLSLALFNKPNPIRWLSRKIIPERYRWKTTNWVREQNLQKQGIPPKIKNQLLEAYKSDIKKLEGLIDQDLSHWFKS